MYWSIVLSKITFFLLNPTGEKCFNTTEAFFATSEGNEEFRPPQVSYETLNTVEFSVEDEVEKQRAFLTRKIAKLIQVSHDPRARFPSIPVLMNAIAHLFDEKIPQSIITKLVSCRQSSLRYARNNARAFAYIAACPHKETRERESLKEFAAEQGWEQINNVAKLLESSDAMRKPKSRRSAAKFNPNLEIRFSSKEEFQLSRQQMAEELTWGNIDMMEIPGMGRGIIARAPFQKEMLFLTTMG